MYEANGGLDRIVGSKVERVQMDSDYLAFHTDKGVFGFTVEGDCCSYSYFWDLIGYDKLVAGPVVSVADVSLEDPPPDEQSYVTEAYGFEIVTDHPEFGEVTTVLSFRNDSNGYYGGWMYPLDDGVPESVPFIAGDVLETAADR